MFYIFLSNSQVGFISADNVIANIVLVAFGSFLMKAKHLRTSLNEILFYLYVHFRSKHIPGAREY